MFIFKHGSCKHLAFGRLIPRPKLDWPWNIGGGVPRNVDPTRAEELSALDIYANPSALSESVTSVFSVDSWSIPIGWLLWICLYMAICLCAVGEGNGFCFWFRHWLSSGRWLSPLRFGIGPIRCCVAIFDSPVYSHCRICFWIRLL